MHARPGLPLYKPRVHASRPQPKRGRGSIESIGHENGSEDDHRVLGRRLPRGAECHPGVLSRGHQAHRFGLVRGWRGVPVPAEPRARARGLRRHLPHRGPDRLRGRRRLLRLLQVPRHPLREQADHRRRLRRLLMDHGDNRVLAAGDGRGVEHHRDAGPVAVRAVLRPQGRHLRRRRRAHARRHGPRAHLLRHAPRAAGHRRAQGRRADAGGRRRDQHGAAAVPAAASAGAGVRPSAEPSLRPSSGTRTRLWSARSQPAAAAATPASWTRLRAVPSS
uniref:Uncharacterized protein n=1 Tax=Triticum urartu TaxID=4572 RepID=A0A8R7P433_TRIUA